ncbi:MAG: DMT family transporter [Candidatus Atabeyarchaeum deiterrae]
MADGAVYWIWVLLAVTGGIISNIGVILQKKVVNEIPLKAKQQRFFRSLVRRPVWLLGLVLSMFAPAAFVIGANLYIGPALVPGLMNAGLIVLAIGSVRMNKEKLQKSEYAGILLMMAAVFFLGFSMLSIDMSKYDLNTQWIFLNSIEFTAIIVVLWAIFFIFQRKSANHRAVLLIFASGFMYVLTNFWVAPLSATIFTVLQGIATVNEWIFFILSCVILPTANLMTIANQQTAYRYGQASNLNTIQQFPTQLVPVFVYLFVFQMTPPSIYSLPLLVMGTALVLISSFLLARRKEEISKIK